VSIGSLLLVGVGVASAGGTDHAAAAAPRVIPAPATLVRRVAGVAATDGTWRPRATLRGKVVVWATRYHPLPTSPSTVASAAVIDQFSLRGALFNGPVMPGGYGWRNGNVVMARAKPSLVAAFNGGFEYPQMYQSGYKTEGRTMKALVPGIATLAVSRTGLVKVGLLGIDFRDDGSWVSLRQNLPAVVINGQDVTYTHTENVWGTNFGTTYTQKYITNRSAICTRADTRLMYVYVGSVNVKTFAKALVNMGCRFGMELDINGTWPQFATYSGFGTSTRGGQVIDSRMTNVNRYVVSSQKDFIAFFDRATLPAGVVA
jgi:hypothetical protein